MTPSMHARGTEAPPPRRFFKAAQAAIGAPLLLALLLAAFLVPRRAAGQSADEIKDFRGALEVHMAGNLPKLVAYLRQVEPSSLNNLDPPAAAAWTAQDVWDTRTVTTTTTDPVTGLPVVTTRTENYIRVTAAEVRNSWRAQAESELQRIAAAAPAGSSVEAARTVLDDGTLDEFADERMDEFEDTLQDCDDYAAQDDPELENCLQ